MATYFVDATGGSDAANGLTTGTAWQTVAKVNASSFSAGDSIAFKRGERWREALTVPSSGSSGNPIVIGAYDTGADPIISGANLVTGWQVASGGDSGGLWIASAETNDTTAFTAVVTGGTSTFAAGAVANTGAKGYTATTDGTNSALGYKTLAAQTDLYLRLYFRVKAGYSLSEGQDQVLVAFEESGGTNQVFRVGVRKSSGALTVFMSDRIAFAIYDTVGLVTVDTWHRLLIRGVIGASGGISVVLNGVSTMSNFTVDLTGHAIDRIRVGLNANSDAVMGAGSIVYLDDLKADTSTIGTVPSAPANSYVATVATVPRAVWQDDAPLTAVGAIAALTAGSWFHDGVTSLYVNATDGSDPTTKTIEAGTRSNGIKLQDKSHVTVDGLQVEKTNDTNKGAIWASTSTGSNATHVTVQNCTVRYGMSGIMFQSIDDLVAENNTVSGDRDVDLSGIFTGQASGCDPCDAPLVVWNTLHTVKFGTLQPIDGVTDGNTVNGTWRANHVYNTQNYGMQFNLSTAPVIEQNLVHDGGTTIQDTHGIHWADSPNAIVRYNRVYNWSDNNAEPWSGGGIQADNNSDDSVIYGNLAFNNDGPGIAVCNAANVLVSNNTCYGNNQGVGYGEFSIQSPDIAPLHLAKGSATLMNNIGMATRTGTYAITIDTVSLGNTNVITNNLWFKATGNWYAYGGDPLGGVMVGGTKGADLATWNGYAEVGTDLNADPVLANPPTVLYVRATSPAIDAGVDLGASYRYGLRRSSSWPDHVKRAAQRGTWDLGAYPYARVSLLRASA